MSSQKPVNKQESHLIKKVIMKALIFANGNPEEGVMVHRALSDSESAQIIVADGGARVAWHYQKSPDTVIGDMDSLSETELQKLRDEGATLQKYPPEKDETDLELALKFAVDEGATWIRIIGAIGGRFDQMLANVYLLSLPELRNCDVAIVADNQLMRILYAGEHPLEASIGDTISLIPINGDVTDIRTTGLQYPLKGETLHFGPARGISNVVINTQAKISFAEGVLLCVHTQGRA